MQIIDQVEELKGKTVFMRTDFDVPLLRQGSGGQAVTIGEPFRIERQKETLHYLLDHGARVVLAAHMSAVPNFEPLIPELERIIEAKIVFRPSSAKASEDDSLTLIENTRQNPGEEANDETFARELVAGCDLYVNNAFAVCHRAHASVVAAAKLLPAYAGFLVAEEVRQLSAAIKAPMPGKVIFIGGAKVDTKLPVINYLLGKAEVIAVGGKIANEMQPPVDSRIRLPMDFAEGNMDIGPQTAAAFAQLCIDAKFIVWNGPMGKFEDNRFMHGTEVLAQAIAQSTAQKVVGGGDTVAAVDKLGLLDKMGFVSTGGGAMLAFLAGERLPGLEALGYYAD